MKKLIVGLLAIMAFSSAAYAEDIIIIANKDVPDSTLTQDEIKKIFLGRMVHWSDNSRIHAATVRDEGIHEKFLKQYLEKTEAKWKIYWKRMVFTGRGVPPKSINTEAELIAYVAETKGALGYISSDNISGDSQPVVKIINVR
jgi:ABC-type phosphate transport system substrate-binding protein